MLHNGSISGAQKFLQEFRILCEFGLETNPHDGFLDFSPVGSERLSTFISTVKCLIGSGCADDVLFLGLTLKLLGLEEMFISRVLKGANSERGGINVVEFAVFIVWKIEVNGFLFLHEYIYKEKELIIYY